MKLPPGIAPLARRVRSTAMFRRLAVAAVRRRFRWEGPVDSVIGAVVRRGIFTSDDRKRSVDMLIELFFDVCGLLPVDLFIEAGAKEASASRRAVAEQGCVAVAFEANPFTHRRFTQAATDAGVRYEHLALSDTTGRVDFMVRRSEAGTPMADGQGSLLVRPDHSPGYIEASVEAVTLDSYLAAPEFSGLRHMAMWVDVEGALGQVFGGAHDVLRRVDALIVEVETRVTWEGQQLLDTDVHDYLERFGLRPVASDVQSRHQHNVLYLRDSLASDRRVGDRLARFRRGAS